MIGVRPIMFLAATRILAAWLVLPFVPYMFGCIMSAKVGTGIVAELGAMRINEEIDDHYPAQDG